MARKTLDEQLAIAKENLNRAEREVAVCKEKIINIEHKIEEREKDRVYALLKSNGLSYNDLHGILTKSNKGIKNNS